ncbi:MAG TPA: TIGR03619 family F420-dependent LLM class oxidoreductase [Acidimicrobiia bacterium]|nr:TIGR03619 family F420-dependent LLM class oxidoreductase [Acidimicrobiia bacterium]
MRFGLALPHYDFSIPGESPLRFETIAATARAAEDLGFDSLWVSDHVSLSIERYGGPAGEQFAYEPLTTLAALAGVVARPRLGTLVLCEALRPAGVLAKTLATLDRLCGGRLEIGIGAGWYGPDYEAAGLAVPPPGERLARLREALSVLRALLPGGPATFDGRAHRVSEATNRPPALQSPRPPIIVGGKGDRLLRLVADLADGWNTCWIWTPEAYRERLDVLARACEAAGRDPSTVRRTLGLYALAGEDERDLAARYRRMQAAAPGGMLDRVPLEQWRTGRLVGTVDQLTEQAATWEELGVAELIASAGPLPFSVGAADDLELLAAALGVRKPR